MQIKRPCLGLIAGMGELPKAIALDARKRGYRVVAVAIEHLADESLEDFVDVIETVNVGKLGKIISTLKKNGVEEAVMAGKVPKALLFSRKNVTPDLRAVKLLFTLKDKTDDSILLGITRELEKDGIRLLKTTEFAKDLLTPEGVLTERRPTEAESRDIKFGWEIAKELGRLDIGQTVVVKDLAVMALEAIEGTDEAIKRGGRLAGGGAVVVKVSKPKQDMRFDVPAVGLKTLNAMKEAGVLTLAVEAGKSIFMDRERFIKKADDAGISVVGYRGREH
jgi:DUF1009 family protein